uniref:Large ribosomal subunit protein mL43 n=1 Tax=Pelusios castaneus TaxID=367368 RepID=A0A8C8RA55_9SAUR
TRQASSLVQRQSVQLPASQHHLCVSAADQGQPKEVVVGARPGQGVLHVKDRVPLALGSQQLQSLQAGAPGAEPREDQGAGGPQVAHPKAFKGGVRHLGDAEHGLDRPSLLLIQQLPERQGTLPDVAGVLPSLVGPSQLLQAGAWHTLVLQLHAGLEVLPGALGQRGRAHEAARGLVDEEAAAGALGGGLRLLLQPFGEEAVRLQAAVALLEGDALGPQVLADRGAAHGRSGALGVRQRLLLVVPAGGPGPGPGASQGGCPVPDPASQQAQGGFAGGQPHGPALAGLPRARPGTAAPGSCAPCPPRPHCLPRPRSRPSGRRPPRASGRSQAPHVPRERRHARPLPTPETQQRPRITSGGGTRSRIDAAMTARGTPSRFLASVLRNGLGRYVCQLQRLSLVFSPAARTSRGARGYIEEKVLDFAKQNPGVVVYVTPKKCRSPMVVAEYLNGAVREELIVDKTVDEITQIVEKLVNQSGLEIIRIRKPFHTDNPSIQGQWHPFTNAPSALNVQSVGRVEQPPNKV